MYYDISREKVKKFIEKKCPNMKFVFGYVVSIGIKEEGQSSYVISNTHNVWFI